MEESRERFCEYPYPKCPNTLSENVPLQMTLCSPHQLLLRDLRRLLAPEQLPEEDIQFIFYHLRRCGVSQLALHLGIKPDTMRWRLQRGIIKGEKRGDPPVWQIPAKEMIRVIIFVRNYITIRKAARNAGVDRNNLLAYVQQGHWSSRVHLCGGLAIREEEPPGLKEKYERITREMRFRQRFWFMRELEDNEITSVQLAKSLRIPYGTVRSWIAKGHLPCQKRKGVSVINRSVFAEFARRAIAGEKTIAGEILHIHSHTRKALKRFILTQNPSSLKLRRINPS